MSDVYKAFDASLRRDVAIKMTAGRFSERFDREVRLVASLNHPNLCTLHDVGPNYLVMEWIDGETPREWLKRALPISRSLDIARQVQRQQRVSVLAVVLDRSPPQAPAREPRVHSPRRGPGIDVRGPQDSAPVTSARSTRSSPCRHSSRSGNERTRPGCKGRAGQKHARAC